MAAKDGDSEHLRYEIGDVVYHLLVVMARWGMTPDDLAEELAGSPHLTAPNAASRRSGPQTESDPTWSVRADSTVDEPRC